MFVIMLRSCVAIGLFGSQYIVGIINYYPLFSRDSSFFSISMLLSTFKLFVFYKTATKVYIFFKLNILSFSASLFLDWKDFLTSDITQQTGDMLLCSWSCILEELQKQAPSVLVVFSKHVSSLVLVVSFDWRSDLYSLYL